MFDQIVVILRTAVTGLEFDEAAEARFDAQYASLLRSLLRAQNSCCEGWQPASLL